MVYDDPNKNNTVNISIQYNDIKVQFSGEPENVLLSTISFLTKNIPEIRLAQKISLNYSVSELIEMYSSIIKITPEGPKILPNLGEIHNKKFSDKEIVVLTAFAGIMIATNIFNNVVQTEIDEYLFPFQSTNLIDGAEHK